MAVSSCGDPRGRRKRDSTGLESCSDRLTPAQLASEKSGELRLAERVGFVAACNEPAGRVATPERIQPRRQATESGESGDSRSVTGDSSIPLTETPTITVVFC